jgi:DNA-binding SARP family transcriptional activator
MSLLLLGRVAAQDRRSRPLTIPGVKARALLALLAVRANRHVPTDQLEDELWDGLPPRGARSTIQAHASRLRAVLSATGGAATLAGGAGGYQLQIDPAEIDLHRFEALVADGGAADHPGGAADVYARALAEWRGPALHDVRHVPALFLEAERLDEMRLATIEARLAIEVEMGGHAMVAGQLQRLVDEHPYRERLRWLLMLALYRSGRQVESRRVYRAGYRALAEIGVRPGQELRTLEAAIGREDPSLHGPVAAVPTRHVPDDTDLLQRTEPIVLVEGREAAQTLDAVVERAERAGVLVMRGRAAVGERPYQSVAEALAPLLAADDSALADALAPIVAADPPAAGSDLAFQRFRTFESVAQLLSRHAARRPLVVVLDEIDQAGASTVDLIEHLARRRGDRALRLIVARRARTPGAIDSRLDQLEAAGLLHRVSSQLPDPHPAATDDPPAVADLAAVAADAFDHASRTSARAGDDAMLRLGFQEAAAHYRAALAALDFTAGRRTVQRAELNLALGHACHAAYQLDEALGGYRRAAECAIDVGDLRLLGEAAVGVATATEFAMADAEIEALLSTALDALAPDARARIELLAGLARTLPGHAEEAVDRAREAVQLARTLDAPRPLAIALATAVLVTWSPDRPRARLAEIDEVIARAIELDLIELAIEARAWRAATLDQLGLDREASDERAIVQQWAEQSRRPFFLSLASMMGIAEHLRDGRLPAAEDALAGLPSDVDPGPNFSAAFAAQLFLLRRQQGRVDEFIPLFDLLADDHAAPAAWHAARIVALAETGDPVAGDVLREAVSRLGTVPRDWLWLATVTLLADACIHLGDQASAAELHHRLAPHRTHTVIIAHGIASLGPVAARLEALRRIASGTSATSWSPTSAVA